MRHTRKMSTTFSAFRLSHVGYEYVNNLCKQWPRICMFAFPFISPTCFIRLGSFLHEQKDNLLRPNPFKQLSAQRFLMALTKGLHTHDSLVTLPQRSLYSGGQEQWKCVLFMPQWWCFMRQFDFYSCSILRC